MSNPVISMLISKQHVIWWVRPNLQYSWPTPSDQSTCFLRLFRQSSLPIFFILTFEDLATLGWPCGQASWMDLWHSWSVFLWYCSNVRCTVTTTTSTKDKCQDLAGSWYAQHEHGGCGCKGSVFQWFRGSEESVVAQERQKLRGDHLDCKWETKTRLRSNYSYYAILIVEDVMLWLGVRLNLRVLRVVSVPDFLLLPPAMQICGKRVLWVV